VAPACVSAGAFVGRDTAKEGGELQAVLDFDSVLIASADSAVSAERHNFLVFFLWRELAEWIVWESLAKKSSGDKIIFFHKPHLIFTAENLGVHVECTGTAAIIKIGSLQACSESRSFWPRPTAFLKNARSPGGNSENSGIPCRFSPGNKTGAATRSHVKIVAAAASLNRHGAQRWQEQGWEAHG